MKSSAELFTLGGFSMGVTALIQPLITSAHVYPSTFAPMASVVGGVVVGGAVIALVIDDLLAKFLDVESNTVVIFSVLAILSTLVAAVTVFAGMANWLALKVLGIGILVAIAVVVFLLIQLAGGGASDEH